MRVGVGYHINRGLAFLVFDLKLPREGSRDVSRLAMEL